MARKHSRTARKHSRAAKKHSRRHPRKGQKSRTMKGRKDFTTKKTSKYFNRKGHRQNRSAKGTKRRPFRGGNSNLFGMGKAVSKLEDMAYDFAHAAERGADKVVAGAEDLVKEVKDMV